MDMQLLETSLDVKQMHKDHPYTYRMISEMPPEELLGCWVNLRDDGKGPHEWSGLMRFYRDHVMGPRGAFSVHGYLWLRMKPLKELWKAWGFSVEPTYELKSLKHAPGLGLEWEVIISADTADEVLGEIANQISLAKFSAARAITLLQNDARRKQFLSQGKN
jgi:hypothetical protein